MTLAVRYVSSVDLFRRGYRELLDAGAREAPGPGPAKLVVNRKRIAQWEVTVTVTLTGDWCGGEGFRRRCGAGTGQPGRFVDAHHTRRISP